MLNCCIKGSVSTESIHGASKAERVHTVEIPDEIEDGQAMFIAVQTLKDAQRYKIDFCMDDKTSDIALRVDLYVPANSMSRNCFIKNNWGRAETLVPGWFHLDPGADFELQVYFKVDSIAIALANRHVAYYGHRLPFNHIRKIKVYGAIMDVLVERKHIDSYPEKREHISRLIRNHLTGELDTSLIGPSNSKQIRYLPLPYYAPFSKSFHTAGCSMLVNGKVSDHPKTIQLRLQVGRIDTPLPIIAVEMEVRFNEKRSDGSDEPVIAFKSHYDGNWSNEQKFEVENGLRPGGDFNLYIARGAISFRFYLNKRHIHDYLYIMAPQSITICRIDGDIDLLNAGNESDVLMGVISPP